MTVYNSVIELIGNTPLVRLNRLKAHLNLNADILLKLEMFNPAGSVKDRAALYMVNDFLKRGIIKPGSTLIEPTSGNTGIGLALVARAYGLKLILTMPDSMSIERRQLLKARGAELILTPGKLGMKGAVDEAIRLQASTPGSVIPSQFSNHANPKSHEETTAEEIWRDTEGQIDIITAGVGTGGTITGLARGLKKHNKKLLAVAVEPAESPLITKGVSGPHKIQGIGANFIPDNYDKTVIDEVLDIPSDSAYENAILLNRIEGILAGISAGGNLAAAIELARRPENAGKTIVAIAPDTGEHYLSLNLFD